MPKVVIGTFLEHLDELRRRLWVAVGAFLACSLGSFFYSETLLKWAVAPMGATPETLYFFSPAEMLIARMKLALLAGFLIASPVLVAQFWLFVSPAMHRHERRAVMPVIIVTSALFLAGSWFAYMKVLPAALGFFLSQSSSVVRPMLSVSEYLSFVAMTLVSFGIAFNLPVFILALAATGVVNVRMLNQFQRQVIVLIFIAAAILTPGPDIASQLLMAVPLVALFEVSVLGAAILEWFRQRGKRTVTP